MTITVTLTPDQLDYIRLQIGDTCIKITDEQIQLAYNTADGDDCGTNAILARWNWMAAKTTTLNLVNGGQGVSDKVVAVYKERLDYWELCAGTGPGKLRTGVISYGIDTTWQDIENDILNGEWMGGF